MEMDGGSTGLRAPETASASTGLRAPESTADGGSTGLRAPETAPASAGLRAPESTADYGYNNATYTVSTAGLGPPERQDPHTDGCNNAIYTVSTAGLGPPERQAPHHSGAQLHSRRNEQNPTGEDLQQQQQQAGRPQVAGSPA